MKRELHTQNQFLQNLFSPLSFLGFYILYTLHNKSEYKYVPTQQNGLLYPKWKVRYKSNLLLLLLNGSSVDAAAVKLFSVSLTVSVSKHIIFTFKTH